MKTIIVAAVCLIGFATQIALAQTPRHSPTPKVVSKSHQPVGAPHKVSSFAPRHTNRRVFGDPIGRPIVGNAAPATQPPK